MTTFEQAVIKWILIGIGTFLSTEIIYRFFFKPQEPIIIRPVPRKVEVKRTQ